MTRTGNQLLASILVNSIYEMQNYPVVLLNTVLSPLSFFVFLIFFVSKGTLLGVGIIGGLIMTMFSSGTSLQSDLSHLKNDFKLQDMVVGSPTPAWIYVTGMAISELIYSSPAIVDPGRPFLSLHPDTSIAGHRNSRRPIIDVPHVGIPRVRPGHLILRYRPELCVHEAADDLVLNIGPCLLHNKPDPVAVQISGISFSYHICRPAGPEPWRVSRGDEPVIDNRLGRPVSADRHIPMDRDKEI